MADTPQTGDQLICNACQYRITTADDRTHHYRSEWHRYNVKRRVASLPHIPQQLFTAQLTLLNERKENELNKKVKSKCQLCNKMFSSDAAYNAHLGTKKHQKFEKEYAVQAQLNDDEAAADDVDVDDEGDNDQHVTPKSTITPVTDATSTRIMMDTKQPTPVQQPTSAAVNDDEKADMDDSGDSESVSSDIDMTDAIEAYNGVCMFCNKQFDTLDICLSHMLKQHGFYIPFTPYLTNLIGDNDSDEPGLLAYLGAKIGAGKTCIWCNKRYSSVQGVQQHMRTKDHCKIRLEDEEDEEEMAPFYTFNSDNVNGDTQMTVADGSEQQFVGGGGLSHLNDHDEIVLRDGSVLGHRSLQRVYKQVYRPSGGAIISSQQSQLVQQIKQKYNQLSVPNGNKPQFKHHNPHADAVPKDVQRRAQQQRLYTELRNNNQKHFRAQMMV